MQRHDLAFIDLETTGLLSAQHEIIELAVVLVDGETLRPTAQYETLLRPLGPNGAAHVNRLSAGMLAGAPRFAAIAPALRSLVAGRQVVGHNIRRFDLPFINVALRRTGHPEIATSAVVDTLPLAKRLVPSRDAKLVTLAAHYQLAYPDAHAALADTLMTAEIFRLMMGERGYLAQAGVTVCENVENCPPSGWYTRAMAREQLRANPPF